MSEKVSEDVYFCSLRFRDWFKLKGMVMRVYKRGRRIGDKVCGVGSEGVDVVLLFRFNYWYCFFIFFIFMVIVLYCCRLVLILMMMKMMMIIVFFVDLGVLV